jgi:hypothetical protein
MRLVFDASELMIASNQAIIAGSVLLIQGPNSLTQMTRNR